MEKMVRLTIKRLEIRPEVDRYKRPVARKGRVYLWLSKESILENLLLRVTGENCHPVSLFRRDVIPEILKEAGIEGKGPKFSWSRKAGCNCGCSPGFIVDGPELYGKDVFIDYDIIEE